MYEKIIGLLESKNIKYEIFEHEPVRTAEDAARVRGISLDDGGVKSMIVKVDKDFLLLLMPSSKRLDSKKVKNYFKAKSIRFATELEAEEISKVKMGSVYPFAQLMGLRVYADLGIKNLSIIYMNPGSVTITLKMKATDLLDIVQPEFFDLVV